MAIDRIFNLQSKQNQKQHPVRTAPLSCRLLCQFVLVFAILCVSLVSYGLAADAELDKNHNTQRLVSLEELYKTMDPLLLDGKERQVVRLTLFDCVQKAVKNNYDIRIGSYDPSIKLADVVAAEAQFDAVLFSSAQFDVTDRPNIDTGYYTRTISTSNGSREERIATDPFDNIHDYNYMLGLRKLLPTGASIQVSEQLRRYRDKNDEGALFRNPYYEFGLQFELRQPLLRDFGIDVNHASILASRNNYKISQHQFQQQVISTISEVETNYWRLFFARQRVKIYADLLYRAQVSMQRIEQRQNYDSRSQVLSRTNAVIKKASADLVAAENAVLQQQDILLSLLNDPDLPLEEAWEIILLDIPTTELYEVEYNKASEIALQMRSEYISQKYRIATAKLGKGVAENQALPRLDLIYQQDMTGAGYNERSAWRDKASGELNSTTVGLSFEIPIGNREAKASLFKASKQLQQESLRLLGLRENILTDVSISVNNLSNNYKEINARLEAVQADSNEILNYMAMEETERSDTMTPEFINLKLNANERLANSQISAIQVLIEYNLAIMDVHRAQGTLLRYNNIKLEEIAPNLK